jgi:hypothetical protein
LRAAFACLALGYAAWLADERGWWCEPTAWWQGHALRHILTAVAGVLAVEHLRVTAGVWRARSASVGSLS